MNEYKCLDCVKGLNNWWLIVEIRSCEDIVRYGFSVRPNMNRNDYFKTKWVEVNDLIKHIDNRINEVESNLSEESIKDYETNLVELKQLKIKLTNKSNNK